MSLSNAVNDPDSSADVIVVGAGPAGATAATYLARSGVDVLLLEKSTFPRDKVCGDGLTPRGVKQVLALGVDVSGSDWIKNKGLRVVGGGNSLELPWPVLQDFPDFGLVRPRRDFDEMLATLAVKAGARMRVATTVTAPVRDDRTGRITGVIAKTADGPKEFRAPLIVACDGVSARVALGMGINKRDDRPLGVAVRRYYNSPSRTNDDYLESHLELWDRSNPAKAEAAARLRLDLRARRRHGQRRARHAQLVQGVRQDRLPGAAAHLAGRHPGGVGAARGERDRLDRRRRTADGLQPHPALRRRTAAGRRRRRRGQPVQRRGHRLRDGVRGAGRGIRAAGARPAGRAQPGGRPARLRDGDEGPPRRLLPARRDLLRR